MIPSQPLLKDIVSVAEMARMLCMSRSRFYQLMQDGVFPAPLRKTDSKRPFYDRQGQEKCLHIRQTNCGANGKPILFYVRQIAPTITKASRPATTTKRSNGKMTGKKQDGGLDWLRSGLKQLGLDDVNDAVLRSSMASSFPQGIGEASDEQVLATVYRRLKCQNTSDKVD